ncbi:hypothetical protein Tco_0872268 [Tanacetum coccineum]
MRFTTLPTMALDSINSMYCDTKALLLMMQTTFNIQIQHIRHQFHFIKEHVENGVIELYFVNMEYQLADIFTKALGRERIEFLIKQAWECGVYAGSLNQLERCTLMTVVVTINILYNKSPKLSRLTMLMLLVKRLSSQKLQRKRLTLNHLQKQRLLKLPKVKKSRLQPKGYNHSYKKSKGLTILSEVALSKAEQMKLETKRSLKEFHISHASGLGAGDKPEVPEYISESEEESWIFSQGEDEEYDEEHDSD